MAISWLFLLLKLVQLIRFYPLHYVNYEQKTERNVPISLMYYVH